MSHAVTEADLHAYVDGQLPESRRAEIEIYLETHVEDAQRIAAYREQNTALHARFDTILDEPIPERIQAAARPHTGRLIRTAAAMGWLAIGGTIGWFLHGAGAGQPAQMAKFVREAAVAHVVYTPEVRHPVEVGADQQEHLVNWLSKRLGAPLKVPQLGGIGYQLVGGRLLPGSIGPVAQFMYQDGAGQRLTLYLRTGVQENKETAFRFAREGNVGVFYWVDGRFGYALSGEIERTDLLRVANAVYQQLNP